MKKVLLSPRLFIYRDIDEINGTYVEASISHTVRKFDRAELELSADLGWGSAGYDRGYFAVDDGLKSNAWVFGLTAGIAFGGK